MTDKTEEADAVGACSAAAEEADDEQKRSDADEQRRGPVQRLVAGRRRLGAGVRGTGGGRQ